MQRDHLIAAQHGAVEQDGFLRHQIQMAAIAHVVTHPHLRLPGGRAIGAFGGLRRHRQPRTGLDTDKDGKIIAPRQPARGVQDHQLATVGRGQHALGGTRLAQAGQPCARGQIRAQVGRELGAQRAHRARQSMMRSGKDRLLQHFWSPCRSISQGVAGTGKIWRRRAARDPATARIWGNRPKSGQRRLRFHLGEMALMHARGIRDRKGRTWPMWWLSARSGATRARARSLTGCRNAPM
ncbi:hypothetical protein PE067_14245 [Paracoccus sp. DMF-8]|uniref:hypothetical protein n=1 Tax=Paracoccus sp. DMF-8 TaxID=3019445 RepID=UPI0023E3E525|nr:hypothetical protein [Paracoccus sp. DMF-8]MDF3607190.1 hypothetical protein [Paracoccus sp. DMF-8]